MKKMLIIVVSFLSLSACAHKSKVSTKPVNTINRFLYEWVVSEKGSITNASKYAINISAADNSTDIFIENFNNSFTSPISAAIIGDSIYIPNQLNHGKVVFGVGYIWSNATYGQYGSITMNY